MMFLLRSMFCLSIVYVAILRGGFPWTSHAGEHPSGPALADARDHAASGLMALCRQRSTDCLAALAAATRTGVPVADALAHAIGGTNDDSATDSDGEPDGARRGGGPEPRRRRPGLRLTTTP